MTQADFTGSKRKPGEGKPNRKVILVPAAALGLVLALFLTVTAARQSSPLPIDGTPQHSASEAG